MSRTTHSLIRVRLCFPRVSGDEPKFADTLRFAGMFSPRERG